MAIRYSMIEKTIGIYSDLLSRSAFNEDTLVVEIGVSHIACLVKMQKGGEIAAFEFYKAEDVNNEWDDLFYELRTNSGLLDKSYGNTKVFYNVEESVLIPAYKFNGNAAANYIDVLYGDADNTVVKQDDVKSSEQLFVAYRIHKTLHDAVNRNFLNLKQHHVYTASVQNVLSKERGGTNELLKLQFYEDKIIAAVTRDGKLQIVQSFSYQSAEDVLYYALHLANTYNLNPDELHLELSGVIASGSQAYQLLQQYFKNMFVENIDEGALLEEKLRQYPLHYFSPFFNLAS
jgi:hypothetical protein